MSSDPFAGAFKPSRTLGRTGFQATILGIGDLADRSMPIEKCVATVRRAMDAGLNLIDTAPSYESGYSEQIVGEALKGRRDGMFVIDKIDHHDQPVAEQVAGSLGRLGMDNVDAFVFHGLSSLEGWRRVAAPGGGMEQLARCIEQGKCRFRGISSHDPEVLVEAINSGLCDVVLFAVGAFCDERYTETVLPLAREKQVGTVCFKAFGAGKLLCDTTGYSKPLQARLATASRLRRPRGKVSSGGQTGGAKPLLPHLTVAQCVHYALSLEPDVALLGLSFPNEQDAAFAAALSYSKLPGDELAEIRRQAAQAVEGKGNCWWDPQT